MKRPSGMRPGPLTAGLLALPILACVGVSISIAQSASDDAAKAALSAGFSKLKAARPDTAASNPVGLSAGFEAVTREREFQSQFAAEQARYNAASPEVCQAQVKSIDQCIATKSASCTLPAALEGYSVGFCRSVPWRPVEPIVLTRERPRDMSGNLIYEDDDDDEGGETIDEMYARIHRAQADWDIRYSAAHRTCQVNMPLLEQFESCVAPARAACNPRGATQASCQESRQAAQPTRASFQAKLDQIAARKAPGTAREDYPGQDAALSNYAKILKELGVDTSKSQGKPAADQERKDPAKLYTYELEKTFTNVSTANSLQEAQAAPGVMRKSWENSAVTIMGFTQVTPLSVGAVTCNTAYASVDKDRPHKCWQVIRYRVTSKSPEGGATGRTISR